MTRMPYLLPLATSLTLAVLAAAIWLSSDSGRPAEAHGTADQSQTQSNLAGFNNSHAMMQEFVPTTTSLVAVDVKIEHAFSGDPAMLWTVAIRRGYPAGPIIALVSRTGLAGTSTVYHVDFPQPVPVTPGTDYWLEVAGEGNLLLWSFQETGNPYPAGEPDAVLKAAYPNADRYFVTYGPPPVTPTPRPTRTPRIVP